MHKIIIGIDFGTTYSGIAWADSSSPDKITPIRQWPHAVGKHDVDKVPSEMVYLPNGTFRWGFQATPESVRKTGTYVQYIKLLLDPSQETNNTLADPLGLTEMRARLPHNKQPVDVVADYLHAIKTHALEVLMKSFGDKFWKVIPIEYHLTIPAVWSEAAKASTLKAATKAGIGSSLDLIGIAEPEAAAIYCLTQLYPELLQVGDTFVVVDCGGGTVDLISYKVLSRKPKIEVSEVAVGGGLCGSVFLNRRFESHMKKRLGSYTIDTMRRKGKPYFKMMKEFDEHLKRVFRNSDEQEYMDCEVPGLPDDPLNKVEDGFVEISREEMQAIFNPVIDGILELVQEQINSVSKEGHKPVSSILLVGGFGSSPYLYERVKEHVSRIQGASAKIKVHQPENAWSAVALGAVICGLQTVNIKTRKARRNFGVLIHMKFNSKQDSRQCRVWCKFREEYRCIDSIRWLVHKGDEIAESQQIKHTVFSTFSIDETDLSTEQIMFASDSAREDVERHSHDPSVYQVCSIEQDLRPLRNMYEIRMNSKGERYYFMSYDFVMNIHSAQLTFGLEFNGIPYGNTTTVTFN